MAGERGRTLEGERPFSVSQTAMGERAVLVTVSGAIDVSVADSFEDVLAGAVDGADKHGIVVDLSEVTFLDSTALTALVHCFEAQRARLQRFSVVADDARVRSLLEVTQLDRVLNLHATREEAKAFVSGWS